MEQFYAIKIYGHCILIYSVIIQYCSHLLFPTLLYVFTENLVSREEAYIPMWVLRIRKNRKGKYTKAPPPRKSRLWLVVAAITLAAALGITAIAIYHGSSVYQKLVWAGYTGTQEQWLASLVGEEVSANGSQSAYSLACENGYRKSEAAWIKTLTGISVNAVEATPYEFACENGFDGTLVQWLTQLADSPETLGRSGDSEDKTVYELACEYGYTDTFIQWLVSVANDSVFE